MQRNRQKKNQNGASRTTGTTGGENQKRGRQRPSDAPYTSPAGRALFARKKKGIIDWWIRGRPPSPGGTLDQRRPPEKKSSATSHQRPIPGNGLGGAPGWRCGYGQIKRQPLRGLNDSRPESARKGDGDFELLGTETRGKKVFQQRPPFQGRASWGKGLMNGRAAGQKNKVGPQKKPTIRRGGRP